MPKLMKPLTLGAAALATFGLVFAQFGTPSAWADGGQADVDATAAQIADAAPASAPVEAPTVTGDQATAQADGTTASVPLDPAQPITLTDTGSTDTVNPSFTISMPKELQAGKGQKAKNGTMVYRSSQKTGAHGAVQVHADGSVSLDTVIDSARGATRFTYTIGNATPVLQADGSVNLVQTTSQNGVTVEATVATIAAPWAKDAKGNPVATHFQVIGNKLVQVIQATGKTAYPVVADPYVKAIWHWWGISVYYSKAFTRSLNNSWLLNGTSALGGLACGALTASTLGIGAVACAAGSWVFGTHLSNVVSHAAATGGCVRLDIPYFPSAISMIVASVAHEDHTSSCQAS